MILFKAWVDQLVERWPLMWKVPGSNPSWGNGNLSKIINLNSIAMEVGKLERKALTKAKGSQVRLGHPRTGLDLDVAKSWARSHTLRLWYIYYGQSTCTIVMVHSTCVMAIGNVQDFSSTLPKNEAHPHALWPKYIFYGYIASTYSDAYWQI